MFLLECETLIMDNGDILKTNYARLQVVGIIIAEQNNVVK